MLVAASFAEATDSAARPTGTGLQERSSRLSARVCFEFLGVLIRILPDARLVVGDPAEFELVNVSFFHEHIPLFHKLLLPFVCPLQLEL